MASDYEPSRWNWLRRDVVTFLPERGAEKVVCDIGLGWDAQPERLSASRDAIHHGELCDERAVVAETPVPNTVDILAGRYPEVI